MSKEIKRSMNCLFCNICDGSIPSRKVYEDEHALAFLDINPVTPGHTLVIPKTHSTHIFDIDDMSLTHMMSTVKKVANAIKKGLGVEGVNILSNAGAVAGQVIFHTHMHIVPRYADDGLRLWPGKPYASEEEAQNIATHLAQAIK